MQRRGKSYCKANFQYLQPSNNLGFITSCAKINIKRIGKLISRNINIVFVFWQDEKTERIPMRTLLARLLILLEGLGRNQKADGKILLFTKVYGKGQKAFDIYIKPF